MQKAKRLQALGFSKGRLHHAVRAVTVGATSYGAKVRGTDGKTLETLTTWVPKSFGGRQGGGSTYLGIMTRAPKSLPALRASSDAIVK